MRLTAGRVNSVAEMLQAQASARPDRSAYTFLEDGEREAATFTWAQLDRRSRAIAAALLERVNPGARALLIYPPGLEFIAAFFGCLYAGVVAVPSYPPGTASTDRTLSRLRGMASDAGIGLILAPRAVAARTPMLATTAPELAAIPCLATDVIPDAEASGWCGRAPERHALAFLQYTSGSTAAPRGVMVTHANLLHNLGCSRDLAEHGHDTVSVSWLPVNHDMGLIDGVLQPAWSGFHAYLMAPAAFLQRPVRWLQAMSRLRATHSGGPNFAYDLCVRRVAEDDRRALDLATWRTAFNGSEPVRVETLRAFHRVFGECGFRWEAFRPAYGLAEATLLVSSGGVFDEPRAIEVDAAGLARGHVRQIEGRRHTSRTLVCAGAPAPGTEVAIVDPDRRVRCRPDRIGEIWVRSESVTRGYWQRHDDTQAAFGAILADSGEGPFLRTGDLGFLRDGRLFVTGRIKDVLIVRGLKHYPQDIEATVEGAVQIVRPGCSAAVAIEHGGVEVVALAAEIDLRRWKPASFDKDPVLDAAVQSIRQAVGTAHGITLHSVALLPPGSIPKTTSGKIRRFACRALLTSGSLEVLYRWTLAGCEPRPIRLEAAAS
jgi:acyl-CoA synthetase (AMP-forming)/AMP-acid ligase II